MTAASRPAISAREPLINGAIGVAALLLGAFVIGNTDSGAAAALRALPPVDAQALAARAAGEAVLIEGRVAADEPVIEADLVWLLRQQAVGVTRPGSNEVRFAWETRATVLPPRPRIASANGVVTLVNHDFAWRDPPRVVGQPSTVTAGTERRVGFAAGDAVTVRAVVVEGTPPALRAIEIYGGTREQYLRDMAASDAVPYVLGGGFALLGAVMLGFGLVEWRRLRPGY